MSMEKKGTCPVFENATQHVACLNRSGQGVHVRLDKKNACSFINLRGRTGFDSNMRAVALRWNKLCLCCDSFLGRVVGHCVSF